MKIKKYISIERIINDIRNIKQFIKEEFKIKSLKKEMQYNSKRIIQIEED